MPFTNLENQLRNAKFQNPERMPIHIHINGSVWDHYREALEEIVARHPRVWPFYKKGQYDWNAYEFDERCRAGEYTDAWGCLWRTTMNGVAPVVMKSPLESWDAWDTWEMPDPLKDELFGFGDISGVQKYLDHAADSGNPRIGTLGHGFFFLRMTYLRGFENTLFDMMEGHPKFDELVKALADYNRVVLDQFLNMGVDVVYAGEDLGTQHSPLISPDLFRKYCAPTYKDLFTRCHEKDALVLLHSDGYILDLVDDILNTGVDIINPQDLCNGIDNLERVLKGRVCIQLDIDRQTVMPFGTPAEIRELVEYEVRTLGSPQGGLELLAGIYLPTPLANIEALACAMEEFEFYWFS